MDEAGGSNAHANVLRTNSNPAPHIEDLGTHDVFLSTDNLQQQWVEDTQSFVVCIPSEIIDPGNFWVQVEKTRFELVDMMLCMRDSYRVHRKTLAVKPRHLCENLIVVILRNGWYFRSRILELSRTHVEVLFVDYGKTVNTRKSKIYHLHKKFSILKAQAIQCKMFNLKAATYNLRYPASARTALTEMIKGYIFVAVLDKIHEASWTLEVSLHPLPSHSLPISDWLVRNGHAKYLCNPYRSR